LAHACSPDRGSEPGAGWHRAVEAARHFDTWVICRQQDFAEQIERHIRERGEIDGLRFVFVPYTAWEQLLRRVPRMFYLAYNLWHRRALRVARRLHERLRFDLVHQANMCGYREPGYLWKLDAPFVWGPVGGTQNYPWRFLPYAGVLGAITEGSRSVVNALQLRLGRRVRRAVRRASPFLAANSTNQRDFARVHGVVPERLCETGISDELCDGACREDRGNGPLRILWSGVFGYHKALPLLLEALSSLPATVDFELRIAGDGPLAGRWKRLARQLGLVRRCRWLGWLPRNEVIGHYDWADVFVFTSLRDTTGTVILEALARGVPVICLDHQGAGDVVTSECGIKIPVSSPRQVVAEIRSAIERLSGDRAALERLRLGARSRGLEYSWSRQGERMAEIYRRVLEEAGRLEPEASRRAGESGATGSSIADDGMPAESSPAALAGQGFRETATRGGRT
jgi:glycosyltransferase involved in cell wall biosynthesis